MDIILKEDNTEHSYRAPYYFVLQLVCFASWYHSLVADVIWFLKSWAVFFHLHASIALCTVLLLV
jgi:hypothetical protein